MSRANLFSLVLTVFAVAALPAQITMTFSTFEPGGTVGSSGLNMFGVIGQPDGSMNSNNGGVSMANGFVFGGDTAQTLFVELDSLIAVSEGVGSPVAVQWETVTEIDNAGFNVYTAVNGGSSLVPGLQINTSLIPSEGGVGMGAAYEVIDSAPLQAGDFGTRAYFVEDIDLFGRTSLHGPVFVQEGRVNLRVNDWSLYD